MAPLVPNAPLSTIPSPSNSRLPTNRNHPLRDQVHRPPIVLHPPLCDQDRSGSETLPDVTAIVHYEPVREDPYTTLLMKSGEWIACATCLGVQDPCEAILRTVCIERSWLDHLAVVRTSPELLRGIAGDLSWCHEPSRSILPRLSPTRPIRGAYPLPHHSASRDTESWRARLVADITNPHDRFFPRDVRPGRHRCGLRGELSSCVRRRAAGYDNLRRTDRIRSSTPTCTLSHSDLLLRVSLHDGGQAWVYILVEHKSFVERQVTVQLLRYLVRIWERDARDGGRDAAAGHPDRSLSRKAPVERSDAAQRAL